MDTNPAWNAWRGIDLTAAISADNLAPTSLDYCDISDATGFGASVNVLADQNCPGLAVHGEIYLDGTLLMPPSGPDFGLPVAVGPTITNCTFSNYGGCAILTDGITNGTSYGDSEDWTECGTVASLGTDGNVFTPSPVADGGPFWVVAADACLFDSD
jgi:hypothetical protein